MAASTSIYQPILYWIYDQGPRREPEYRVPPPSIQLVLQKTPRVGTRQKLARRGSLKTQYPLPPITDQMLLQPYLLTTHDDTTRQGGRPARFKGDTTGALITAVARAEDCGLKPLSWLGSKCGEGRPADRLPLWAARAGTCGAIGTAKPTKLALNCPHVQVHSLGGPARVIIPTP